MEREKYKKDAEGAVYLDKQYWDWKECLHFTDKESIDKHALPILHVEMRSNMYPEWKFDDEYKEDAIYDMNKVVFRVTIHEDNGKIVDNFIEPCIIYGDDRPNFDQYFVDRVSSKVLERIKSNKVSWKHLALSTDSEDSLTIIDRKNSIEKYSVAKPIYCTDRKWTWTKIFGNYEMANSYRYNKYIELKNKKESEEYDKFLKEASEILEDKKVITLTEIAKAFNCDKDKIILDLSR